MRICVVDTETTGLDAATAGVVEYAHVCVDTALGRAVDWREHLVNPGPGRLPIPPEARAVHHIRDEDVVGELELKDRLARMDFSRVDVFAAHNAKFDAGFVRPHLPAAARDIVWVDTWRVASHLWPDAPSHSNQVLRYWLCLNPCWPPQGLKVAMAHRALYDACCTAALLLRALDKIEQERVPLPGNAGELALMARNELLRLNDAPIVMSKVRFGKYYGRSWEDVPHSYLAWCLQQTDWDPDLLHTINHWYNRGKRDGN